MRATKTMDRHRGLDQGGLFQGAPAVFATRPSERVSEDYQFLRTADLLPAFVDAGLVPVEAAQSATRSADGKWVGKHLIRFQPRELLGRSAEVLPEILLENSHNTARAVVLALGMWRLVCSNGMRVGSTFSEFRVRHIGDAFLDQVRQGLLSVTGQVPVMGEQVREMMARRMSEAEALRFADLGHTLRWPDKDARGDAMLRVRRGADHGDTVWQVFNRVQENVLRGGHWIPGAHRRARATGSLDTERVVNRGLWDMAWRFMETGEVAITDAEIVDPLMSVSAPVGAPSTFVVGV